MMAERNQKVFDRVRQELGKNPSLGSRELYEMAQRADSSISGDTLQQFHARYVLPLKREQASAKGGGTARRRGRPARAAKAARPARGAVAKKEVPVRRRRQAQGGSDRDRIRSVLLRFAQDFSNAETKPEIVKVMSKLDDYVNQIAG